MKARRFATAGNATQYMLPAMVSAGGVLWLAWLTLQYGWELKVMAAPVLVVFAGGFMALITERKERRGAKPEPPSYSPRTNGPPIEEIREILFGTPPPLPEPTQDELNARLQAHIQDLQRHKVPTRHEAAELAIPAQLQATRQQLLHKTIVWYYHDDRIRGPERMLRIFEKVHRGELPRSVMICIAKTGAWRHLDEI